MATRGWEVSRCFLKLHKNRNIVFTIFCKDMNEIIDNPNPLNVDLTDTEEARKAFIASEIFNRKY